MLSMVVKKLYLLEKLTGSVKKQTQSMNFKDVFGMVVRNVSLNDTINTKNQLEMLTLRKEDTK